MLNSEIFHNFTPLNIKVLTKEIVIVTEDKVTEIIFIADKFGKVFDAMVEKFTEDDAESGLFNGQYTMSKLDLS